MKQLTASTNMQTFSSVQLFFETVTRLRTATFCNWQIFLRVEDWFVRLLSKQDRNKHRASLSCNITLLGT